MASARIRHTFKYPSDDDHDEPEGIDEEEQENVISKLRGEIEAKNKTWLRLFLALTIAAGTIFLPSMFKSAVPGAKRLGFLSISSISATAFYLVFVPKPPPTDRAYLQYHYLDRFQLQSNLLQRVLPYLNGALSLLIAISGMRMRNRVGAEDGQWAIYLVPPVMWLTIVVAKKMVVEVDIDELERLKYKYKGA